MKQTTLVRSLATAAFLAVSSLILSAQTAPASCPLGHEPGYGRSLTPEQRTAHRAEVDQLLTQLRQKQANGSLTSEEQALLQRFSQRGGPCVNGTPRGQGRGKGPGAGNGAGQRKRQGLRDGTGPRCGNGTCPVAQPSPSQPAQP